MFWFFGQEACGILALRPGMVPTFSALEGEVLTTGQPGKSQPTIASVQKCTCQHRDKDTYNSFLTVSSLHSF